MSNQTQCKPLRNLTSDEQIFSGQFKQKRIIVEMHQN